MKAYIFRSDRIVEPFGDNAKNCLIGNKKLTVLQREVLNGLLNVFPEYISDQSQIDCEGEYITFGDNVYFTQELLEEFIRKSREMKCKATCSLKIGITTKRTVINTQEVEKHLNYVKYNLHYTPETGLRDRGSQTVVIDPDVILEELNIPKHMCESGKNKYLVPITDKLIVQIDHWTNLWSLNVLVSLSDIARMKNSIIKKITLAVKAGSLNKWKILAKMNTIGENCDIHNTAYIEGSTIGNNVTIKAGAVVREAVIGDGVTIGNNVAIEASVIGMDCTILHGHIMFSVLYPETFSFTQMISASMIGQKSFIGSGVVLTDFRFDEKDIIVTKGESRINTENRFTGSCLGHEVYLGSGCIIAPGRTIPNGMRIIPKKDKVIEKCDDGNEINGFRVIKKNKT